MTTYRHGKLGSRIIIVLLAPFVAVALIIGAGLMGAWAEIKMEAAANWHSAKEGWRKGIPRRP